MSLKFAGERDGEVNPARSESIRFWFCINGNWPFCPLNYNFPVWVRERVTAAFKFSKRERERSRTLERTYKFGFVEYKNLLQASLIELVQKGRKSNFIMYKKKKKISWSIKWSYGVCHGIDPSHSTPMIWFRHGWQPWKV